VTIFGADILTGFSVLFPLPLKSVELSQEEHLCQRPSVRKRKNSHSIKKEFADKPRHMQYHI
jgi:hypothetical protein